MSPVGAIAATAMAAQLEAAAISQLSVRIAPHPARVDVAAQACVLTKGDGSIAAVKAAMLPVSGRDAANAGSSVIAARPSRAAAASAATATINAPSTVHPADLLRILQVAGTTPAALHTSFVVDPYGLNSSAPLTSTVALPLQCLTLPPPATSEPIRRSFAPTTQHAVKLRPESDPRVLQVCRLRSPLPFHFGSGHI